MKFQKLITQLINNENKKSQRKIFVENPHILNLEFAESLKNTYYTSWTTEPNKTKNAANALEIMFEFLPLEKILALANWVRGISFLAEGKTEKSIKCLDESAEIFEKSDEFYNSAQTKVSKLYALALLGRYDEAIEVGKNALQIFLKFDDELSAGKIENNLGNIVSRQELHHEAEKYYKSARTHFIKANEFNQLVMSENGLAITYSALNDFRKAEEMYQKALQTAEKHRMFLRQAEIEASLGNLNLFRGKFDKSLSFLEKAREKYETLKMNHQVAISELEIADAYLELNLVSEAFEIYARVSKSLKKLKIQGEEARSRANFGRSAILLQQNNLARNELKKAAKLYVAENNLVGAATVKLNEAQIEISAKNYKKAYNLTKDAEKLLRQTANFRHKLTAKLIKAECLIEFADYKTAKNLLRRVFTDAINQENVQIAQLSQISLGNLSLKEKNLVSAEKYFQKAIEMIENLREPLPAEEFRMAFLANKLLPYQRLAEIYLQKNRLAEAFEMIERSRSRALAESINFQQNYIKENIKSNKLSQKLQDLREELNWFYSRINRANESELGKLQNEAKKREREIAELQRKFNATNANSLQNRDLFNLEKVQTQLGKEKILLEFVGFEDEISAFVITDSTIHFVKNLANETEIAEILEGLHFQFGALRYGAKNLGNFLGELKKRADFYLQKLYEKLIKPLESFLEKRNLVVAPFGKLHYVPFNALHDGKSYLIENRGVSSVASASVWQFCQAKSSRKTENALLIGFADEKIPLVNQEIETLSKIFEKKIVLTENDASFSNFKQHAENAEILHIACHGEFRQDNPMFSALRLADGWITVRDVCAMNLNAELVTLSACETGLNLVFTGEELLGLSRGFLSAGASSLLLTLWNVNDEATQNLMKIFYEEVKKGKSFAESLRIAKLNFIKQNAHPYFWSPFILIGKG
jgi:CHAT domain-containing protein/tetratricopeptide (TPR) repeat protein